MQFSRITNERKRLKAERAALEQQLENMAEEERRLNQVTRFPYNKKLMEAIETLINRKETNKYTFSICGTTFEGKTHQVWVDTTPVDPSGCSSWGDGSGYYKTEKDPNVVLKFYVLMEQTNFDVFTKMSFSNAKDYSRNLRALASGNKDLVLEKFDLSQVSQVFPYIGDFLGLLVEARLDKGIIDLDDETIEQCLNKMLGTQPLSRVLEKPNN